MTCLGGDDPHKPLDWVRNMHGELVFVHGRIQGCPRAMFRGTFVRNCSGCAAYRGPDITGRTLPVLYGDDSGSWNALSQAEYDELLEAEDATLDDDWMPMTLWLQKMQTGLGRWNRRVGGVDLDVSEWWADYMRRYRARNREAINARRRETYGERERAGARERMRKRREMLRITAAQVTPTATQGISDTQARARACEGAGQ